MKKQTILGLTKNYRIDSFFSIFFVLIEIACVIFIPKLTQWLIDFGIKEQNTNNIYLYSGIILILGIVSLTSGMLSGFFASRATAGLGKNIRYAMFEKISNYSFENYDKYSKGSLIVRLTNDITNVQNAYMMSIRALIRAPFLMTGAIIMAFTTNFMLAWILVAAVVILSIIVGIIMLIAFPRFYKMLRSYDEINNKIKENISGIRTIKTFVTENKEIQEFKEKTEKVRKLGIAAEKLVALNSPLMLGTVFISLFSIMLVSANLIGKYHDVSSISTGTITAFVNYMFQVLISLMIASMVLVTITIAQASIKRIKEILNEVPSIQNPKNPIYEINNSTIEFENVNFMYKNNKRNTLKKINLTILPKQTIGIIGSTGSGKSTLVNLLPRLYDVTEGELKIGGINVKDYDLKTLRESIAIVLQKNILFSGTIRENIRWGKENATDEEIIEALKKASAYDFVFDKNGLDTVVEEGGANFSGGQKQRLSIARALIKKPEILILDDSTSAVDNKTDAKIRDALNNELKDTTKIIIAQRVSSIENADRIIILENGRVTAFDNHKNLLATNEFYKNLYEAQLKDKDEIE
ncbi:ABC transporter ATP-binding protein [Mycoplasmopsis glycophila]|uniref:ABC-type multidrug/protein/lipid transport system ATPase component n=1 Tax=Mycoplasmopsis glycophila TaxID=171285 RepID=A0A449AV64_9BACT|nr:ABC transporter ATP-binding protein [Mycoplasmopsis glycophila]VEU70409.1 ABC-type multidrug/protein/lipid transport system ATPase component [Mycoplasmopsis glycophila]